jgi:hypothetical protein
VSISQQSQTSAPLKPVQESDAAEFAAGFQRVEAEIRAVEERDLVPINVDVQSAVATVLGALPGIRALRDTFARLFGFDLARFDKLRDYTLALGHAHGMYRAAATPTDGFTALAESVMNLRDILEADAVALAKRKILDQAQVTKLTGGAGYKNIAFEVVGLVGLIREHWDAINGRSALQKDELEQAGKLAQQLVIAIGVKEQAPAVLNAATGTRQRAFTLFTNAYDDVRRAVTYLHWGDDKVNEIAPSFFAGRGGRGTPDDPTPPNTGTPATAAPVAITVPSVAASAPGVASAPQGMPGSSPFKPS